MSEKIFTPHTYASGDFMLGDFVYVIEHDGKEKVVKINVLTRKKIGYFDKKLNTQRYVRNCDKKIKPIPVSDLNKFDGFKTTGEVTVSFEKNLLYLDDKTGVKQFHLPITRDIYIHDIQHILAVLMETEKNKIEYESKNC